MATVVAKPKWLHIEFENEEIVHECDDWLPIDVRSFLKDEKDRLLIKTKTLIIATSRFGRSGGITILVQQ